MVVRIQLRHDSLSNWTSVNPILADGEVGFDMLNNKIKIGNGGKTWASLPYLDEGSVHVTGTETVGGDKTFTGEVTFNSSAIFKGSVVFPEDLTLTGTITKAEQDGNGNVFEEYYQKLLANSTKITANTDWDTLDTGAYAVTLDAWGSYLTCHTPNETYETMYTKGILLVFMSSDKEKTQLYIPAQDSPIVSRCCKSGTWGSWYSASYGDPSTVHTTGDESVGGVKSFTSTPVFESGSIDVGGAGAAQILHNGTSVMEYSIQSILELSGANGIVLYPNGTLTEDARNQAVTITTSGVIEGKCKYDQNGKVIDEEYTTRANAKCMALLDFEYMNDTDTYEAIVDLKTNGTAGLTDVIDANISIPYTLAKNGAKIVDSAYEDTLESIGSLYGTCNYFLLDTTNKQYMLPADSPTGMCHVIKTVRNTTSGQTYEYNTNLEGTLYGTCTVDTAVVFDKPFADDSYYLSVAYSAKSATGFTPSASGQFFARGRVYLSS